MKRLRFLFHRIIHWLFLRRASRPQDIPKKLASQELERAMTEARFLYIYYGVEAHPLGADEIPSLPRPVERLP